MLFFGKSDIGKIRPENEDTFLTLELCENVVLCIICDGMGGYEGGAIASELAVTTFSDYVKELISPYISKTSGIFDLNAAANAGFDIAGALIKAATAANTTVIQRGSYDQNLEQMGTTLLASLIIGDTAYILNVGDSRLYYVTENDISQVTRDHSYIQDLISSGYKLTPEEADASPFRNYLTSIIGHDKTLKAVDTYEISLKSGYIMMCSDGLYTHANKKQIQDEILKAVDKESLIKAAENLINIANANGGSDNITVILIKSEESDDPDTSKINAST